MLVVEVVVVVVVVIVVAVVIVVVLVVLVVLVVVVVVVAVIVVAVAVAVAVAVGSSGDPGTEFSETLEATTTHHPPTPPAVNRRYAAYSFDEGFPHMINSSINYTNPDRTTVGNFAVVNDRTVSHLRAAA